MSAWKRPLSVTRSVTTHQDIYTAPQQYGTCTPRAYLSLQALPLQAGSVSHLQISS